MELLIMIDAMKRASAGRINAIIPYYGYARQDRKAKARDPITAKLVGEPSRGIGRRQDTDHGSPRFADTGIFRYTGGSPRRYAYTGEILCRTDTGNLVIVSPDHGSVTRARNMAQPLNAPIAIVDKRRPEPNKSEIMHIIGDIEGKDCILVDDMIDTAGTITNAANALKEMGANSVRACATHGVLSGFCHRAHRKFRHRGAGAAQYHTGAGRKEDRKDEDAFRWRRCLRKP